MYTGEHGIWIRYGAIETNARGPVDLHTFTLPLPPSDTSKRHPCTPRTESVHEETEMRFWQIALPINNKSNKRDLQIRAANVTVIESPIAATTLMSSGRSSWTIIKQRFNKLEIGRAYVAYTRPTRFCWTLSYTK